MKHLLILLLVLLALAGCRSHKQAVRETIKVEKVTQVKWDTVYLEVPAQTAEAVTLDSVSFLETDFATSTARINPDGTLYHNLSNKEQERPQVVPTIVERNDSIVEREVPVPVYVEKTPSKWERFKSGAFWWLCIGLAVSLAVLLRKPLIRFAKKLLIC